MLLCEESLQAAPDNADGAIEWAELAVLVARRAPGEEAWKARVERYAWAHLGNARKVKTDLRGADHAFAKVHALGEKAADAEPGPLSEARVLGFEASLRAGQQQFPLALALIERALQIDQGELRLHLLIQKAKVLADAGNLEEALVALQRVEPLLDRCTEPRLIWAVRANTVDFLSLLNRFEEAAQRLPEVWKTAENVIGALDRVRRVWIHGRIAAGTGQPAEGIAALEQVRKEFAATDIPYDWTLATLELAVVHLECRHHRRVKELAVEMAPVFKGQRIHREALAALTLFWRAVEQEEATAELGKRIVRFLHQARLNPGLKFNPNER